MTENGKKEAFEKRLRVYSAAAAGVLAIAPSAEAAIQYSGIQNLPVNSSQSQAIDMNNDAANDFSFYYTSSGPEGTSSLLAMDALANAGAILNMASNYDWANLPLNYSVRPAINLPFAWFGGYEPLAGSYSTAGSFNSNGAQGYIGVRFESSTCNNGSFHYGWIQWRTDTRATQGTVIDWAYEDVCNQPIIAGQTESNDIPTMSQWGMIVFTLLLGGIAARRLRKQAKEEG